MVLGFVSSQQSVYLVFQWKVNQLKASEGNNKICIHVLWVVFSRATFAFRRKHVAFTYFAFVTVTWLSIVHSSKTIYHVSLYSEKERRFLPQLLLISQSDWLICRGRWESIPRCSRHCVTQCLFQLALWKKNIFFDVDIVVKTNQNALNRALNSYR